MDLCPYCGEDLPEDGELCSLCEHEIPTDIRHQSSTHSNEGAQTGNGNSGQAMANQQSARGHETTTLASESDSSAVPDSQLEDSDRETDTVVSRRHLIASGMAVAAGSFGIYFLRETEAVGILETDQPTTDDSSTVDPGTDFDDAPVISSGQYGEFRIEDGESHYFAVELDQRDELTAMIYFDHGQGDLDLTVHDPETTQIDGSFSTTDDEVVTITAEESGTYYIRPYGFREKSNNYELEIEIVS